MLFIIEWSIYPKLFYCLNAISFLCLFAIFWKYSINKTIMYRYLKTWSVWSSRSLTPTEILLLSLLNVFTYILTSTVHKRNCESVPQCWRMIFFLLLAWTTSLKTLDFSFLKLSVVFIRYVNWANRHLNLDSV